MATDAAWHDRITTSIGGAENYGKGIWPNPWVGQIAEYQRRKANVEAIESLSRKILMLTEPRFVTGTETSELMEVLIRMVSAKQILELGMHTGRTTLHLLRAIVGVAGAQVVSIDSRPTHDKEFFAQFEASGQFKFIEGWTPQCLDQLAGRVFDFVFVDSAHDLEHTRKEWAALQTLTRPGTVLTWHDMPEWESPAHHAKPQVRLWLEQQIADGAMRGLILPSPEQLDCREEFGQSYDYRLNPGLAITIRT